jgi:predicted DNA-binding ribbon-helix-helix protein
MRPSETSKQPLPETESPSIIPEYPQPDWENVIGHPVQKRSVVINGHKTSISFEGPLWSLLRDLCELDGMAVGELMQIIDNKCRKNLSSTTRLYLFDRQRAMIAAQIKEIKKLRSEVIKLKHGIEGTGDGEEARAP